MAIRICRGDPFPLSSVQTFILPMFWLLTSSISDVKWKAWAGVGRGLVNLRPGQYAPSGVCKIKFGIFIINPSHI